MKNLTLIITFSLLFSLSIFAQDKPELAITNIPAELLEEANAVVRYENSIFEVKDFRTATETRKVAVTRLNKQAKFDGVVIGYDASSRIQKIKIELYDAFGNQIRKFKKDEIQDRAAYDRVSIYTDNRLKYADVAFSSYPYTIVYEYQINHSELMSYPRERLHPGQKTSIQKWDFTLITPPNIDLKYRVFNDKLEPKVSKTESGQKLFFSFENKPTMKYEPYAPTDSRVMPTLVFLPKKFGGKDFEGDMTTWNAFGKFMYQLNKRHNNLSPEMVAKVKEMTAEATTDAEKIDILYNYVQENMRYVSVQLGIGGWRAYDAAYVEKNKYGDCKALTWFTKSMLETIGIESYPALVLAGREHTTMTHPEDFSSPRFNHVILTIPSEETWLECTSNDAPTNYLGSFTDNRTVMLITEEGGKLMRTPAVPIKKNKRTGKTTIQLNEKGGATVLVSNLYTGPKHERFRYFENNFSQEEFEKYFLKSTPLPSCEIQKLTVQTDPDRPKALLDYEVTIRKYGSKGGKRMFVPANCVNSFNEVPDAVEDRKYPVVVKRGYVETDEIVLQLPKGYKIESIPENTMNLSSEFGEYTVKIEKNEETGEVLYKRNLKILPVDLPAERYEDLRQFYKKIAKADKMKIVLVEKET